MSHGCLSYWGSTVYGTVIVAFPGHLTISIIDQAAWGLSELSLSAYARRHIFVWQGPLCNMLPAKVSEDFLFATSSIRLLFLVVNILASGKYVFTAILIFHLGISVFHYHTNWDLTWLWICAYLMAEDGILLWFLSYQVTIMKSPKERQLSMGAFKGNRYTLKRDNSIKFAFVPSEKGSTLRGKKLLPVGANSVLFE